MHRLGGIVFFLSFGVPKAFTLPQCLYAKKTFNPDTEFCCYDQVLERLSGKDCCTLTAAPGPVQSKVFDTQTHICCGGSLVERREGFTCCDKKLRSTSAGLCCRGKWNITPGDRRHWRCCAEGIFNRKKEQCCKSRTRRSAGGEAYRVHSVGRHLRCCGLQLYNRTSERCDIMGERVSDLYNFTCGDSFYNSKQQTCCQEKVIDKPKGECQCCGADAQLLKHEMCCQDPNTGEATVYAKVKRRQCCGRGYVDLDSQRCCNNRIKDIGKDGRKECCGDKLYNNYTETCCGGVVRLRPDLNKDYQCCGNKLFDSGEEQCIDFHLHRKNERECLHQDTDCICAREKIRETEKICCMGKPVAKGDPTHNRCCLENSVITTYNTASKDPSPCKQHCSSDSACCEGTVTNKSKGDRCCGETPYFKAVSRCKNGQVLPRKDCHLKKQADLETKFCKYNSATLGRIADINGRHIQTNLTSDLRRGVQLGATLTTTMREWRRCCPRKRISRLKGKLVLLLTNKKKLRHLGSDQVSIKISLRSADVLSRVDRRIVKNLQNISC